MEKQTSPKKVKLPNYVVLQSQKERKLKEKKISLAKAIEANMANIAELKNQLLSHASSKENQYKTIAELEDKIGVEFKNAIAKISTLNTEIEAQKLVLSQNEASLKEILDAKQKEIQDSPRALEIKSRLAYLNAEINESNYKIGEYKKEAKREQVLSAQIQKLKKDEENLTELIKSGQTTLKRNYNDELDVAKKERAAIEKQLKDFCDEEQVEIARLSDINTEMSAEAAALNVELSNLRKSQDDAAAAMQIIEADPAVAKLRKSVEENKKIIAANEQAIEGLNAEIISIKAKKLEEAQKQGKEEEYKNTENQLTSAKNEIKTLDSKIATDEKNLKNAETQKEKNEAKLLEVEAGILECDNYNEWTRNNKKFSEQMYPKALEFAANELRLDKNQATEETAAKIVEEAKASLTAELAECKKSAEKSVDERSIQLKGAIRDTAVNNLAQSLFNNRVSKYIEESIEKGTNETWNNAFRKIRAARLKNIEKNIADAEKTLANNKTSEVAKTALENAKNAKEMFERAEQDNTLLVIRNVRKYFPVEKSFFGRPTRYLKAVDDVSLRIQKGKTLGIVGESGCGKTTMGRTVLRLHDITDGEIIFDGQHIESLKSKGMRPLRTELQIIFQDPYSSLSPRLPVGEIIGEAVRAHNLVPKSEHKEYILDIMKSCGLQPHYYSRYPHEFSGGQRQRICIARALAVNPKVVICDEPVSALDVSIQAQIINLLKDLQRTRNLTYIFISHDLSVVEHISDDVGVMYLGSMVESGPKEKIFDNPMHPYTEALLSAVPVPDPNVKMNRIFLKGDIPSPSRPPRGCKFHTRCHKCMDICKIMPPVYREYEKDHFVACHLYPQD